MITGDKSADIGNGGIVTENPDDCVDKRALAICPRAVGKAKHMLSRYPGAAISDEALQEFLGFDIGHDAIEER